MPRAGAFCWWTSVNTSSTIPRQGTELRHSGDSCLLLEVATAPIPLLSFTQRFRMNQFAELAFCEYRSASA